MATIDKVVRHYNLDINGPTYDEILDNLGFYGQGCTLIECLLKAKGLDFEGVESHHNITVEIDTPFCVLDVVSEVETQLKDLIHWDTIWQLEQRYTASVEHFRSSDGILRPHKLPPQEKALYGKLGKVYAYLIERECRKIDKDTIKEYLR